MNDYYYSTNVIKKIDKVYDVKLVDSFCCWSDLLGFGRNFTEKNWVLNTGEWEKVTDRLVDAQNICFENIIPFNEFALVLNDGIVRSFSIDNRIDHISILSVWLRSCVYFHIQVNKMESYKGLPGVRTIIASGQRAEHNFENLTLDDFVFNYTKPDPNGISQVAKTSGNPIICYNPKAMQMNTAFSKAYIIDEAGSSQEVSGANLFIDQSVIDLILKLSRKFSYHCGEIEWVDKQEYVIFGVPKKGHKDFYHLGFELYKPEIHFDTKTLKTKVWKVKSFYVHDEKPKDFKINIDNNTNVAPSFRYIKANKKD
ncbi:hypothetical protein H1S01_18075 [Heliobacterium chlorum]|uniref:Uncharacterized protein n=1 Tax=Heliobacterium chlorum TaxID=2698 RepID=A0ABR7T8H7_HELCL|nr:hypothetical protein [Heliobacterium chlorum]MBC9786368.1 hypothetical protein [Heliobacterium chlorum]